MKTNLRKEAEGRILSLMPYPIKPEILNEGNSKDRIVISHDVIPNGCTSEVMNLVVREYEDGYYGQKGRWNGRTEYVRQDTIVFSKNGLAIGFQNEYAGTVLLDNPVESAEIERAILAHCNEARLAFSNAYDDYSELSKNENCRYSLTNIVILLSGGYADSTDDLKTKLNKELYDSWDTNDISDFLKSFGIEGNDVNGILSCIDFYESLVNN